MADEKLISLVVTSSLDIVQLKVFVTDSPEVGYMDDPPHPTSRLPIYSLGHRRTRKRPPAIAQIQTYASGQLIKTPQEQRSLLATYALSILGVARAHKVSMTLRTS